jgi:hypothetical protein
MWYRRFVWVLAAISAYVAPTCAIGGVEYLDPAGGWRYTYGGTFNPGVVSGGFVGGVGPAGYGQSNDSEALDGTWLHDQSDKWDGSGPGVTGLTPNGPAPGGAASITEDGVTYVRVQDTGNPEAHGFVQGAQDPINTNRRIYFGRDMNQDGAFLPPVAGRDGQRVLDNGITISFRMRIPDSGPLDNIYAQTGEVLPWFESPPADYNDDGFVDAGDYVVWRKLNNSNSQLANEVEGVSPGMVMQDDYDEWKKRFGGSERLGRGYPVHDDGRGMITILQHNGDENDPFYGVDGTIAFSLITGKDIEQLCDGGGGVAICTGSGSGGLLMNNLSGSAPNNSVDVFDSATLNLLEIPDASLDDWHEFWITIVDNGAAAGTHDVNVYVDGSTAPMTFQVTASLSGNGAYANANAAFLEFGLSSTDLLGSFDMDFYSYKLGVVTPVAAGAGGGGGVVPEPTSFLLVLSAMAGLYLPRNN